MEDEQPQCQVEYLDVPEGEEPQIHTWIARAGRARVTYPDGNTFEGAIARECPQFLFLISNASLSMLATVEFNAERRKEGRGIFVWMTAVSEDDDARKERARYEGEYVNGKRHGNGRMVFPNGDIYHGQWTENQMHGEGTYVYKASGDIYSGSFENGRKHGEGIYEYQADQVGLINVNHGITVGELRC